MAFNLSKFNKGAARSTPKGVINRIANTGNPKPVMPPKKPACGVCSQAKKQNGRK